MNVKLNGSFHYGHAYIKNIDQMFVKFMYIQFWHFIGKI